MRKGDPKITDYSLKNGVIVTADKDPGVGAVQVQGNKLGPSGSGVAMDLGGVSFVYPALINTHDHMRGNYLPRVGPKPGTFYLTWLPWDNDLKASEAFMERSKILPEDIYFFSAYKNLFSGVTTVHDHFPQSFNRGILPTLPVRAILNYGLAHEASSYDLKWGDGIEVEHKRAVANNWPFITHLSEGFDDESMGGVETLERLGVLDNHCLLVHGIGFSDEDIRKVARAGASISWCPASNMFMFNVTCKIRKLLQAGVNVTIGTDSTHTGSCNLLVEIRFARELYRKLYGEDLPGKRIFEMITCNAARAFWLEDSLGSLDEGKLADILVLKAQKDDPYENLVSASMADIELLTMDGKPIYGELRFIELLGGSLPQGYTRITVNNRPMFIVGDPASLYRMAREKVGFKKLLDFLPFEPEVY
ncbi:MAG: amidohydrolase family protein [Spirochaetaceae bacterium]|jgi:cytosine/adenosine deaminase-related metal-dependent hydrolase|nr:amidohydrolase family protein [Spirochaetaceae bacterium]